MKGSFAALLFGLIVLGSCLRSQSQLTESALPLRVGFVKIADSAQLFVGLENGYYSRQGLHIETQEFQMGSLVLEALVPQGDEKLGSGANWP